MEHSEQLKISVREKYGAIAQQEKEHNESSCCGSGCCSTEVYRIMSEDYQGLSGYEPEADLGLGCGLPTRFARIEPGDVVLDLGSGAGNDAFVARHAVGRAGKVIGIDFTPAMIARARANAEKLGFVNVEFREGDIEHIPVTAGTADVVISNCVLNLVPGKDRVIGEIYRVLKPGGHFSISDIVLTGELPPELREAAEMYAGCISGAVQRQVYLELIRMHGFEAITVQQDKPVVIPGDILAQYLSSDRLSAYRERETMIRSVTVFARKPADDRNPCCGPGCCGG